MLLNWFRELRKYRQIPSQMPPTNSGTTTAANNGAASIVCGSFLILRRLDIITDNFSNWHISPSS